ncbi:MAG: NAD(P)/FAD-dependent oxidoreductase [Promethearchaeota archaeon]
MYDLIVVGAGPAGASAARFAVKHGLSVALLDKAVFPRDKPCGGALTSRTLPLLGAKAKKTLNTPVNLAYFASPSFLSITIPNSIGGHFIIRKSFDHAMLQDAQDMGADVFEHTLGQKIQVHSDHVEVQTPNQTFRAKTAVLADGVHSRLVRQLGLRDRWPVKSLVSCLVSETVCDDTILSEQLGTDERGFYLFATIPKGYCWFFPKRGYVNVGLGFMLGLQNATKIYRNFVSHLRKIGFLPSSDRLSLLPPKAHPVPVGPPLPKTFTDRVLVVGDAAGFVSPLTGEGLYYGIRSSQLAADTITSYLTDDTNLAVYQNAWLESFGNELIKYALPVRNLIYNSPRRVERMVKMTVADPKLAMTIAETLGGLITYKKARNRFLKRAILALPKSFLIASGENRDPNPFGAVSKKYLVGRKKK